MKLSDKAPSTIHHILVFGPPKSGKTHVVGTLAEKYKLIWFDLENGYETLLQRPKSDQENIEIISLPDTRSFPIAIETMLKAIKGAKIDICEQHGKISCAICRKNNESFSTIELNALDETYVVVIDSLTQLTNSAIAHITKLQPDDYKLNYDDWGNLGKLMDMFLSHVQNAPFNIVCISHETEVEMEDGKNKLVPTAGTRNFSRNTARYFGDVIYCEVKNKKHIAASSTTYANNILTGSRSGIRTEDSPQATLLGIFGRNSSDKESGSQSAGETAIDQLAAIRERMALNAAAKKAGE